MLQIDTSALPTIISSINFPTWVPITIVSIIALLSAVQYILKKIPTPESVKIQGVIGAMLDLFTFFQKDIIHTSPTIEEKKDAAH
jgi:hypothetical protein